MMQAKLFKAPVRTKPIKTVSRNYDKANLATARLMLTEPELHEGFPVIWARAVVARLSNVQHDSK